MPIEGIFSTQSIWVHVDDDGLPAISETPGGSGQPPQVDVTYRCKWSERFAVYRELLGGFASTNLLGIPTPGHAYPPSPNLSCLSVGAVQPYAIDKTLLEDNRANPDACRWDWPKWCLLPVSYGLPDYATSFEGANPANQIDPADPILFCRQRAEINNSFIVVDNATMEILQPRPLPTDPFLRQTPKRKLIQTTDGIPANTVTFTLEFPRIPVNPWLILQPFVGKTNFFPMWNLPPGHLLFAGVSVGSEVGFFGSELSATLTYIGNVDLPWNETIDDDGIAKPKVFVNNDGSTFRFPFDSIDLMIPLRS